MASKKGRLPTRGMLGKHHAKKTKEKMRKSQKRRFQKEDVWNKGKKCPELSREQFRKQLKKSLIK